MNYHGVKSRMLISATGTGAFVLAVKVTDWSLDMSTDTAETTGIGDTNKTYVQGLPSYTGSFNAIWDNVFHTFFAARKSADGCRVAIYPMYDDLTKYIHGPAWLSMSMSGGTGDAVKISGNFVANGQWAEVGFA